MSRRVMFGTAAFAACLAPFVAVAAPAIESEFGNAGLTLHAADVYGRESSLPLCDWSTKERTLWQFIGQTEPGWSPFELPWTCHAPGVAMNNDTCSWSGYVPTNETYAVAPRNLRGPDEYHQPFVEDLAWPDGSGAYQLRMMCAQPKDRKDPEKSKDLKEARDPKESKRRRLVDYASRSLRDAAADDDQKRWGDRHDVVRTTVQGQIAPWAEQCSGPDDKTPYYDAILADVDGGTVEHIRPGLVRGTVTIALGEQPFMQRLENDLEIAIQVLVKGAWHDMEVTKATAEPTLQTIEVEAMVSELEDVRLQVRGRHRCDELYKEYLGYDLRDARIFVETCVPDQSEPGKCL